MVTDNQIRRLKLYMHREATFELAAAKAGMDEKTARKYVLSGRSPSEMQVAHTWCTRSDAFEEAWPEIEKMLEASPGLEAKSVFGYLQRQCAGRFADGQLRTLQRRVKVWRALYGPSKEVFFPQVHVPGILCQSDFTSMNNLNVRVSGQPFDHLFYHFVLTYSNWETGTVCFSESFESLSNGLQKALWELGGVPAKHQCDRLSAAWNNLDDKKTFTERYSALLRHYHLEGHVINAQEAHENGDVEQRHNRLKRGLDQELLLRGSRDFASRETYTGFLRRFLCRQNAGRKGRLREELNVLGKLPARRLDAHTEYPVLVSQGSTISLNRNIYSLPSRLKGEWVKAKVGQDEIEIWYAQRCVERLPRLQGRGKHRIDYRHIIDQLIRKPGAFANYRYLADLFPTHRFRAAYDHFTQRWPQAGHKHYLSTLYLAAMESESRVDQALQSLIQQGEPFDYDAIERLVKSELPENSRTQVTITSVNLSDYDQLLTEREVS